MTKCSTCGKAKSIGDEHKNCDACRAKATERQRRSRERKREKNESEEKVDTPSDNEDEEVEEVEEVEEEVEEDDIVRIAKKVKELQLKHKESIKRKVELLKELDEIEYIESELAKWKHKMRKMSSN